MALYDLGPHLTALKCSCHCYQLTSFYLIRYAFLLLPPIEAAGLPLPQFFLPALHMHGRSAFTMHFFRKCEGAMLQG